MAKICGIYKITNLVNNKVYIGQSIDVESRFYAHLYMLRNKVHYNSHLQNTWDKYGENNFKFEIIEECRYELLDDREKYYIKLYRSYLQEYGYNLNLGGQGDGGHVPTEETRRKMSESHKGMLGTPESRAKQSAKLSGENNPMYGRCGELNPTYGIPKTEAQREKLIKSWTEEKRNVARNKVLGDLNPMFGRCGGLNHSSRAVVCLNTGDVFETLKDAAAWCGLKCYDYISRACKGKQKYAGRHPMTGEKLMWKYLEDYNENTINQLMISDH